MTFADAKPVRPPAVAGRFYPQRETELRDLVRGMLPQPSAALGPAPKAVISPHAGYVYSGPIAASAYAQLALDRGSIRRIVLIGPSHFVGFAGLAVSGAAAFETPLGHVPVDVEAVDQLKRLPQVRVLDEAHKPEHSLEVQLPFLQFTMPEFAIVPLVVGDATGEQVSEVLDLMWDGRETRVVASSDLSHYHDSDTARQLDEETAQAIEMGEPERLCSDSACGWLPIQGLLIVARKRHLRVRRLDLRNSGDTGGPRDQVVGYGAFAFYE